MTKRRFMELVREYRALAQRKHTSYAEQVKTLAALRAAQITQDSASPSDEESMLKDMNDFIEREYAPSDAAWSASTDS